MLDYYVAQSKMSDPQDHLYCFDCLPNEISDIISCAHALFHHYADPFPDGGEIIRSRYQDLNLRYMNKMLKQLLTLDNHSLTVARKSENRLLGICRDTALFLVSVLRSRGVSARLRAGFVTYYFPGFYLDGFCVEYYHIAHKRWQLVDTRMTPDVIARYGLSIHFDLCNLPSSCFISAAHAWQLCRSGELSPKIFGSRQQKGLHSVANRLVQDLALLNKQEILIWDLWGCMLMPIDQNLELLDELAQFLIVYSNDVPKLNEIYQSNSLFRIQDRVLVDNPFLSEYWEILH